MCPNPLFSTLEKPPVNSAFKCRCWPALGLGPNSCASLGVPMLVREVGTHRLAGWLALGSTREAVLLWVATAAALRGGCRDRPHHLDLGGHGLVSVLRWPSLPRLLERVPDPRHRLAAFERATSWAGISKFRPLSYSVPGIPITFLSGRSDHFLPFLAGLGCVCVYFLFIVFLDCGKNKHSSHTDIFLTFPVCRRLLPSPTPTFC